MKIRFCAALLLTALSICMLTGCMAGAPGQTDRTPTLPPETPTNSAPSAPTDTPERITAEEAEDIALAHAGISREQLRYLRTEFDYDGGVPEYDIDFYADGWEYDYEIHAITGQILRDEAEPEVMQTAATQPPATEPARTGDRLTEAQVRDIALAHAGLTADQVTGLRIEFDYDDGRPQYEVDFRYDGFEYDYEIHAETGAILSWDKDRDD